MVQVLCYTSRGFDTCWRPANIAAGVVVGGNPTNPYIAPHSIIRFA